MQIVVVHDWQVDSMEAAAVIADSLGILVFEARQKIAVGGPVVLASFADPERAEQLADQLSKRGVPAFLVDRQAVRSRDLSSSVSRFALGAQALQVGSEPGDMFEINYGSIDLLILASCSSGQIQTSITKTKRKFSMGKTLLAGGVPMTKKVKTKETLTTSDRDQVLWLYTREGGIWVFERGGLDYTSLGDALQISRELNFNYLKNELRQRVPQAGYDERLLRRGDLVRLLGQTLSPENDLDLAFEILARSLRAQRSGAAT